MPRGMRRVGEVTHNHERNASLQTAQRLFAERNGAEKLIACTHVARPRLRDGPEVTRGQTCVGVERLVQQHGVETALHAMVEQRRNVFLGGQTPGFALHIGHGTHVDLARPRGMQGIFDTRHEDVGDDRGEKRTWAQHHDVGVENRLDRRLGCLRCTRGKPHLRQGAGARPKRCFAAKLHAVARATA